MCYALCLAGLPSHTQPLNGVLPPQVTDLYVNWSSISKTQLRVWRLGVVFDGASVACDRSGVGAGEQEQVPREEAVKKWTGWLLSFICHWILLQVLVLRINRGHRCDEPSWTACEIFKEFLFCQLSEELIFQTPTYPLLNLNSMNNNKNPPHVILQNDTFLKQSSYLCANK